MRFFTAIYLNLVLKQNELALVVTKGTNNETIVQGKIETLIATKILSENLNTADKLHIDYNDNNGFFVNIIKAK